MSTNITVSWEKLQRGWDETRRRNKTREEESGGRVQVAEIRYMLRRPDVTTLVEAECVCAEKYAAFIQYYWLYL